MNNSLLYLSIACLGAAIELVEVTPDYYGSGREKQPQPVGYRYAVLLREHGSDKLIVKIPGAQQMDAPLNGTGVMVTFDDLRVRPYVNRGTGQLAFTATAAGIRPAEVKAEGGGQTATKKP